MKISAKALAVLAGGAIVLKALLGANAAYKIKPVAFYDLNGDGKKEAICTAPLPNAAPGYSTLAYFDGKNVTLDSITGEYKAKGAPTTIRTLIKPQATTKYGPRQYTFGELDDKTGIDLKVSDPTPDFPVTIDQFFSGINFRR